MATTCGSDEASVPDLQQDVFKEPLRRVRPRGDLFDPQRSPLACPFSSEFHKGLEGVFHLLRDHDAEYYGKVRISTTITRGLVVYLIISPVRR